MAVLDLSYKPETLFTRVWYRIQEMFLMALRFFVLYGGAGSSKSVSLHQSVLLELFEGCEYDILIMRKVGSDIYDSSYKLLEQIATDWEIYHSFEWVYSQGKRQITNKKTGKRIFFRGADDISKIKSLVGVGKVILEEADAFLFADFREINRRVRGIKGIQIYFVLNPVDENHWIKKNFVDADGPYHNRTHVDVSTYHDNQFFTEEDKIEAEALKEIDENEYNIYTLGKWGRLKTGAEYYPQFKETQHVGDFPFVPGLPVVHLTYDFNVVPYMTLLACQYLEEPDTIRIRVFGEYCLSSPLNTTTAVSEAFIDDYEKYLQTIFYYGDASGNNRIAGKGDEVNFDDVRIALARYLERESDRVSSYNRPVLKRRKLVMKALAGKAFFGNKKIIIEIDRSCVKTIDEFKYLRLGPNGKFKEEVTDNKTGIKYQKYGHVSDAFEYFFCTIFEDLL